jgi:hypothetical protein
MDPETKVKLITDFNDYYDHFFDMEGVVWKRQYNNGVDRKECLTFMQTLGLKVPPFGTTTELTEAIPLERLVEIGDSSDVVVYTDPLAHAGEGKIKLNIMEAAERYPDNLCSLYIPPDFNKIFSLRWLKIADKSFLLRYTNHDASEWRSNYGDDIDIELVENMSLAGSQDLIERLTRFPLVAIDVVLSSKQVAYAVDFNTAPGLRNTPLQYKIKGEDLADALKAHILKYHICV